MALLPPNSLNGGEGTSVHNELVGRDQANAHPIGSITGLQDWQDQQDTAIAVGQALRSIYVFNNTASQDIMLPSPTTTTSLALILTRTSDGAMIEPEVTYHYGPAPMRYIERVHLGFSPPLSGEHIVHIVR